MLASEVHAPVLYVLPDYSRRTSALARDRSGHQREEFVTDQTILEAEVIYAPDLRKASAISTRLRASGWRGPVLLDLAVDVRPRPTGGDHGSDAGQNRLACWGAGGALASYLADVACIGIADGAVITLFGGNEANALSSVIADCCERLRTRIGSGWRIQPRT